MHKPMHLWSIQFSSVAQSCLILCDPMNCSMPGLPVHHQSRSPPKPMSIESVMPSNSVILCHPLLLLPSIFPSIRVFSNESVLHIRWPKYWSFRYTCVPHPEPSSLLPPHSIPLGRPSAPAASIQYRASNLDWQLVSYMIFYMFQCHSP